MVWLVLASKSSKDIIVTFGGSYSVQHCLPLAATIGRAGRLTRYLMVEPYADSSELSYTPILSYTTGTILSCLEMQTGRICIF